MDIPSPDNELYSMYNDFFIQLADSIGISESLYQFYIFIRKHIECQRILCFLGDKDNMQNHVLIDISENDYNNHPYSIKKISLFIDEEVEIYSNSNAGIQFFFLNDITENQHIMNNLWRNHPDIMSLICAMFYDKHSTDARFCLIFASNKKQSYSSEKIRILNFFSTSIHYIISRLFIQESDIHISTHKSHKLDEDPYALLIQCKGLRKPVKLASAVAGRNTTVLITGPTGSGKELFADAIHALSCRGQRAMVKVNCGSIPDSLVDSAFFGHERGAFTGAQDVKKGYFEQAQGGTIYLDEIGELSLAAQVRLLRTLENREITRVGGTHSIPLDVRVIAATNRNLADMVSLGRFREDLWYRINVFPIAVPPLAQRVEDIPVLVDHFYSRIIREFELETPPRLPRKVMVDLMARSWPGNVRQLRHVIERALILSAAESAQELRLAEQDVATPHVQRPRGRPARHTLGKEDVQAAMLQAAGRVEGKGGAAEILNLNPSTLRALMRKQGVKTTYGKGAPPEDGADPARQRFAPE